MDLVNKAGGRVLVKETPDSDTDVRDRRSLVVDLALRVMMSAVAGLLVVASMGASTWLGVRTWWLVGLAATVLGAVWWPRRSRHEAGWAAGCGALAFLVAATAVSRVAPGKEVPGREQGFVAGMSDRILGRDLPPSGVYALVIASALLVLLGVVLALWRSPRPVRTQKSGRRSFGVGMLAGGLASAVLVASVLGAASMTRTAVDRRADADAVEATRDRSAERVEVSDGPAAPLDVAWRYRPPHSSHSIERIEGMAAVPGWDVVIVKSRIAPRSPDGEHGDERTRIQALSKRDGSVLWSYSRHDGPINSVTVDPEHARVLLLAGSAAIVLDLFDGTGVGVRPVPENLAPAELVGDRFGDYFGSSIVTPPPEVTVGSWAVVISSIRELGVVDVATGEVRATAPTGSGCKYAASTTAAVPIIMQWGDENACGGPQLLHVDGSEIKTTDIRLDDDQGDASSDANVLKCIKCHGVRMIAAGDTIVVSMNDYDQTLDADILALSLEGDVLWSAAEATGSPPEGLADGVFLVAATGEHVVAQWDETWHLLALADGTEQARQSQCGDSHDFSTDDKRLYGTCEATDRTLVLRIDDLAVLSDEEVTFGPSDVAFAGDGHLVAASIGEVNQVVALRSQRGS